MNEQSDCKQRYKWYFNHNPGKFVADRSSYETDNRNCK